jgi:hypothetical protein
MMTHLFGLVTPVTIPCYLYEGRFGLAVVGYRYDFHPDALIWSYETIKVVGDNVWR